MYDLDKRVIFTHFPKTAGTTIEAAFGWHPAPYFAKNSHLNEKEREAYRKLFSHFKHNTLANHILAIQDKGIDPDDFYKITTVRNPWDTVVSWYFWDKHQAKHSNKHNQLVGFTDNISFDDYVKRSFEGQMLRKFESMIYHEDRVCIDFSIRFEHYKQDAERIFKRFGLSWPEQAYNSYSRPPNTPYRDMYKNLNTKNMVELMSKSLIELYGYKF